jgi:hypothetical protein
MTVVNKISKYTLHFVGVQVRYDRGGTKPACKYTFFGGKGNESHELDSFFVHHRIISAVMKVVC